LATVLDVSDPATATVTAWSTPVYTQPCAGGRVGWMRDVTYSPDGSRLYIVSSGHLFYPACDSANAFDAAAAADTLPLWTARLGDTIETVAATTDAVYVGGHFRFLDWEHQTDSRFQLGALNPANGRALSWNAPANGFRGILVMEAEPSGLFIGGDNTAVSGVPHGRAAQFPWPNGPWVRRTVDHHIVLAAGDTVNVTLTVTNPGTAHTPIR
jgi:DNA-binding beta-propeller fold protein YncE